MSNKYWNVDEKNFHNISTYGMNLFNIFTYTNEQKEYENSYFYKNLCKRLYEEGQLQVKWLLYLYKKYNTEEYFNNYNVLNYVFSNGFEHFMNVTKKYGNIINGVRVVQKLTHNDSFVAYTDYRYIKGKIYKLVRFDHAAMGTKFANLSQKTEENDYTRW